MKKFLCMLLAASLLLLSVGAVAEEEEKVLNVFTWEGYIDEYTLADFTAETGIKVNWSGISSNEEQLVKLQNNGASEYDLIISSDYILSMARKEGLLLELDKSKLTNYENLDPAYLSQYYDPENLYTVPYAPGSPMLIYDPSKIDFEVKSFDDLYNEAFKDNLCLIDNARVMLGAVLKTLGYSYNTTDDAQLEEAKAKLLELKPNVRVLDGDTAYAQILGGDVIAGYMFTPHIIIAQQENPDLVAVYPEEGIGFGIDALAIPANAPHPNNAHLLIDYLMRPEVAANTVAMQLYLNPNAAATELIDPALLACDALNIPEDLLATKEFVEDVGEYESVYQDIWSAFLTK